MTRKEGWMTSVQDYYLNGREVCVRATQSLCEESAVSSNLCMDLEEIKFNGHIRYKRSKKKAK